MKTINLNKNWLYRIVTDDTPYHLPTLDDSTWSGLLPQKQLPSLSNNEVLWLRCHFTMPPNDECSYWWLELAQTWPAHARIWVNYEALPLPPQFSPAKWEMTYAIAMGDNVVTIQTTSESTAQLCGGMRCVPYPCA